MTSSAQTPEPTDEQWQTAMTALGWDKSWNLFDLSCTQRADVARVARALAAAVTAEREKYLQVADELEQEARQSHGGEVDGMYRAARRIREVSR